MSERPPVYLDNSATTRPFDEVISAVTQSMSERFYNPSALYKEAVDVEKDITACKSRIADQLGCRAGEILFTSGGTEANNLAVLGAAEGFKPGRRILFGAVEHPSVRAAFESLSGRFEVIEIPVDSRGVVQAEAVSAALTPDTALVSVMQINNEVGARQFIKDIGGVIKKKCPEALFHVDGVQGFMRDKINVSEAEIDLYSLSGHKIHAPKGIGALYVRGGARLYPRQLGGGQEGRLRAGTENVPGIAGLRAAIELFAAHPEWAGHMSVLKKQLCEKLLEILPGAVINGPSYDDSFASPHILNISFPGLGGEVLLHALEAEGVLVGTGAACSSRSKNSSATLAAMRVPDNIAKSAIRISLSPMTTQEDIDIAAEKIVSCVNRYAGYKRH